MVRDDVKNVLEDIYEYVAIEMLNQLYEHLNRQKTDQG